MTKNVFDSLLEAAERLLEEPAPAAPATEPPPPGLPDLPPDLPPELREAVEAFARHLTVTGGAVLPPDAPTPGAIYGAGEEGYRRWRLENLAEQAAEYCRTRGAASRPPPEPARRAVAECGARRIEIRRCGTRWLLFAGRPPRRVEWFATPFFDHARRQAEIWFGPPQGGWRLD